ncbi:NCA2-domain-containing protein [Suhomyces tanzawaensis NRRL Y-17324]|uniref:NCA2-domain-containing protein n=1 Tax=Suhomyces tanzawaensis NRRL Y-17324 TaxID=984487 RepID=A0A1E4SIA9_9ASCO|nr:NCA2-domain-containing protein [Suhomyces tanzawaensis NRRL Y-17324]ODV79210.1 NCA2-domain-containing protein [Suhomyces tanzawaensis NRRL Y-17324]
MDFLTPGIRPPSAQSSRVLRSINSNNRISLGIKARFKEVNSLTSAFLTNELAKYSQDTVAVLEASAQQADAFNTLLDAFQQLYYLLGVEDFSFDRVSSIDLGKIAHIYSTTVDTPSDNGAGIAKINDTTQQLINYYVLLTLNLNLANSLIYKTLVLKSNLAYWEDLYNSRTNKAVYLVQTTPLKLYSFTISLFEKDNLVYNNWIRAKHYFNVLFSSGKAILSTVLIKNNPTLALLNISKGNSLQRYKHMVKTALKSPFNLVNNEIKGKIAELNQQIEAYTDQINHMLRMKLNDKSKTIEDLEQLLGKTEGSENQKINELLGKVNTLSKTPTQSEQPSFLTRYWPLLLLLVVYGPSQTINAYNNKDEIIHWFKHNFVDTVYGFFKNWLVKPVNDMLNILRHDDELSITSKESLKSDLDSLERMVIDFLGDENVTNIDKQQIHQSIQNGDLTLLMSKYEDQIRLPVTSILKGSLIRSILIQIQKTKVDGGLAINGIDKLLKSQQLVFGIVSISPSIFIVYKLWNYFLGAKPISINGKQVNILCLKGLNNIENLLINLGAKQDTPGNYEGKLLIEIVNLIIIAQLILPKSLSKDWVRDLNELNNKEYDIPTKISLVRKIWNVYGPYFR